MEAVGFDAAFTASASALPLPITVILIVAIPPTTRLSASKTLITGVSSSDHFANGRAPVALNTESAVFDQNPALIFQYPFFRI